MNTVNLLNLIGLALGIAGTILIFFYGISPVIDEEGHSFLVTSQTDINEKKRAERFKLLSRLGLILIFFGFLLQFIGNLI